MEIDQTTHSGEPIIMLKSLVCDLKILSNCNVEKVEEIILYTSCVWLWVIHIWDHPFKTSANFHDFWPLPPSVGIFLLLSVGKFGKFLIPPPKKNTEILNAWSNGYQNITWSLHLKDTSIFSTLWSKTGHLKYFSGSKLPSLGPLSLILGPWITFGYLYIGRTPWKRHEVVLYLVIGPSQGPKIRRGSYYCGGHNLPQGCSTKHYCHKFSNLNMK